MPVEGVAVLISVLLPRYPMLMEALRKVMIRHSKSQRIHGEQALALPTLDSTTEYVFAHTSPNIILENSATRSLCSAPLLPCGGPLSRRSDCREREFDYPDRYSTGTVDAISEGTRDIEHTCSYIFLEGKTEGAKRGAQEHPSYVS